jgi:glycopeptide antibiotics resistance protein
VSKQDKRISVIGGITLGIMIDLKTIAPLMAAVLIGLLVYLRRKQKRSIGYLFCCSVFYVYLLFVIKLTIFPLRLFAPDYTQLMKEAGVTWRTTINLIPFRYVSIEYLRSVQGFGNVLLTVPFGFGLPFIVATNLRSIAQRGFFFTVSIELVQLLINVAHASGYGVRIVDVNDVMFNLLGALIGFGLFRLSARLYRSIFAKEPAWSHIHATYATTTPPHQS